MIMNTSSSLSISSVPISIEAGVDVTNTSSISGETSINARSIVTLIVFFVVNALVIFPIQWKLSVPCPSSWATSASEAVEVGTSDIASSTKSEAERQTKVPEVSNSISQQDLSNSNGSEETTLSSDERKQNPNTEDPGIPNSSQVEVESLADSAPQTSPLPPHTTSLPHMTVSTTGHINITSDSAPLSRPQSTETKNLPQPTGQSHSRLPWLPVTLSLNLSTSPVIGVLLLLASTCIPPSVVRRGIVGSGGVRPYDIMTLFLSFAYISLSLDRTGLFRYLAALVASRTSSSGRTLYLALYLFFVISGLIIGNDPIVLSGTPFLAYFTRHARISPPTAFIFTQFQAANLVSALLVSSNPTNLVLTSAFNISFLQYSAWTALPTVAAAIVLYPLLRWGVFRSKDMIPEKIERDDTGGTASGGGTDPRTALVDPVGGIFGAALFLITIVALVGLSAGSKLEGVEGVWTVTAPAAIVMFLRDCTRDLWIAVIEAHSRAPPVQTQGGILTANRIAVDANNSAAGGDEETRVNCENLELKRLSSRTNPKAIGEDESNEEASTTPIPNLRYRRTNPSLRSTLSSPTATTNYPVQTGDQNNPPRDTTTTEPASPISPSSSAPSSATPAHLRTPDFIIAMSKTFPTASNVVAHLPLPLVPFAFSMFILVEGLQEMGWIKVFGGWWTAWAKVGGTAGCIGLMGVIGVLGCNVFGTNIGATVLLSRIMQEWQSSAEVSKRTLFGSVFALAIGSNFGAYSFVFSASLAGLLWRDILAQKNLHVSVKEFVKYNTIPLVVTMIVGCLTVAAEVCVIY